MGRVVVTPLYSGAQPLIRYDQGDLAINPVTLVPVARGVARDRPDRWTCHAPIPFSRWVSRCAKHEHIVALGAAAGLLRPSCSGSAPLRLEVRYIPMDWNVIGDGRPLAETLRAQTDPTSP